MWDYFSASYESFMVVGKILLTTYLTVLREVLEQILQFMLTYHVQITHGVYDIYASISNLAIGTFAGLTMKRSMWKFLKNSDELDTKNIDDVMEF